MVSAISNLFRRAKCVTSGKRPQYYGRAVTARHRHRAVECLLRSHPPDYIRGDDRSCSQVPCQGMPFHQLPAGHHMTSGASSIHSRRACLLPSGRWRRRGSSRRSRAPYRHRSRPRPPSIKLNTVARVRLVPCTPWSLRFAARTASRRYARSGPFERSARTCRSHLRCRGRVMCSSVPNALAWCRLACPV